MTTATTRTADVYERVRDYVPAVEWATFADDVEAHPLLHSKDLA